MINCLVLSQDYPNEHSHSMMYVHVRNKYYKQNGATPTVINFSATQDYTYDGINVITQKTYESSGKNYDMLICHAPNVKNHYRFIRKYGGKFKKMLFVFHGHEILKRSIEYPEEYPWSKSRTPRIVTDLYDKFKFVVWRKEFKRQLGKSHFVFVSNWLYSRFLRNIRIPENELGEKAHIINNSVGEEFEKNAYDKKVKKKYDFITIRGDSLDGSKYGIDIVYELAKRNKEMRFLIIGRGKFFKHNKLLPNITLVTEAIRHEEMLKYIDESRCALLPTKEDTQGVMACEMIAYGIPLITSDIEVCREIFGNINSVTLIDNSDTSINLGKMLDDMEKKTIKKDATYFKEKTVKIELDLIKRICDEE